MATSVAPNVAVSSTATSSYKSNTQRISTCILTKNEKGIVIELLICADTICIPALSVIDTYSDKFTSLTTYIKIHVNDNTIMWEISIFR